MSFEDYKQLKAMNASSLKAMAESPRLYKWRTEHPREDTPSLALGRAIHSATLEPDSFGAEYIVKPAGMKFTTKDGKAWREDHAHLTILSPSQAETISGCVRAIEGHEQARSLLADCAVEQTIEWSTDGTRCKGRLDAVKRSALVDVKTCRALKWFGKDSAEYLYHMQLAWYRDGAVAAGVLDADADVYIIAVETAAPHDVAVYRVPPYVLEVGVRLYRRLLGLWLECERTDTWPGRYPAMVDLELPRWADDADDDMEGGDW